MAACAAVLLMAALPSAIDADDPVSSNVRFNREIIRILQRRCAACHSTNRLSMPLTNYRDVRDWGRAIREEIVEQRMPPVTAAPGYGRFQNALGLTARETATLLTWLDGGMPRGDERDLPPPFDPEGDSENGARADVRLELPPQNVPAREELVVRRITLDAKLTVDRRVTRVDVRPGSRAVLRGALVYQEAAWLGGWLPWQHTFPSPVSRAFLLRTGVPLTIVMYYRGAEEATTDRSTIELYGADDDDATLVDSVTVETDGTKEGQRTFATATTIWALQPSTGRSVQSLELRARKPDGSTDVLLWIPATRPEWPSILTLEQPITLPEKTTLTLHSRSSDQNDARSSVAISAWPAK